MLVYQYPQLVSVVYNGTKIGDTISRACTIFSKDNDNSSITIVQYGRPIEVNETSKRGLL